MQLRELKTWQKVVVINLSALAGIVASAFILPPKTPVWLWVAVAIIVLAMVNYIFLIGQRKLQTVGCRTSVANTVIAFGFILFLLDLLFSRFSNH